MCGCQTGGNEVLTSTGSLVKRMARGVGLEAESGPSHWRNADIAAIGRLDGGPGVLRDWTRPAFGLRLMFTIRPHGSGIAARRSLNRVSRYQPCPRKQRPTALAEVLTKLAEICVIEQHSAKLPEAVDPANLGLKAAVAAALIVRIVRGWATAIASALKGGVDADERAFWQRCDDRRIVDNTSREGWQGSRAMQVMIALGLELVVSSKWSCPSLRTTQLHGDRRRTGSGEEEDEENYATGQTTSHPQLQPSCTTR